MKQTAVEWLVEQIKKDSNLRLRGFDIDGIGKQAKKMEKEQIIETWHNGYDAPIPMIDEENCGQQYLQRNI